LTKLHEEVRRGALADLAAAAAEDPPRGEVTIVVEGAPVAQKRGSAAGEAPRSGRQAPPRPGRRL